MSYSENDAKFNRGINDFAAHVEQYAKTPEADIRIKLSL